MHALHKPESVFSLRHLPSWLLLCFAAGAVNATALLACERFVTHVTGTVTRLGMELVYRTILLDFALVVTTFVAGATVAGLLVNARAHRGKSPLFSLPLWISALLVAATALAGHEGVFGPFGSTVDQPRDFVLLSALSFAMGLQNAGVATSTGLLVRTTHLTGPATDLGLHIAELLSTQGDARRLARRHAALRVGKMLAFALGCAVAVPVATRHGYLALLLPALTIASATLISFVPFSLFQVQPRSLL